MKEMEYRILDLLLQNIGMGMSINELNRRIGDKYGLKHSYKEVYQRIRALETDGFIKVQPAGKASIVGLNFGSFLTSGKLAAFELEKKTRFMTQHPEVRGFFEDIDIDFSGGFYALEFIALANPEKSRITNSWDLLFVLHRLLPVTDWGDGKTESAEELNRKERNEINGIFSTLEMREKQRNLKINPLILYREEFQTDLSSEEGNQTKEFIGDSMLLKNPEDFWRELRILKERELGFRPGKIQEPPKITDGCIQFNLPRFCYSSFLQGRTEKEAEKISIETLIAAILLKQDIRLIEAVPILMAKNKINQRSLLFLSKKYGLVNKVGFLLGITGALLKDDARKSEIEKSLVHYRRLKSDEEESFIPDPKRGSWELAKDWKIITNLSMADFKEKARLYNAA